MQFIDPIFRCWRAFRRLYKAGFSPVAHVESNQAALSNIIKTRLAFHYLKILTNLIYTINIFTRDSPTELTNKTPSEILQSVINKEMPENNESIFHTIDTKRRKKRN